jgi:hypothetical protein
MSPLQQYDKLNFEMELPAKELQAAVDGSVEDAGFTFNIEITAPPGLTFATIYLRPDYATERYNNIATGQLIAINGCVTSNSIITEGCDGPLTPQLLFEDDILCFNGTFVYHSRMKGEINVTGTNGLFRLSHIIFKWDGVGDIFNDGAIVAQNDLFDYTADLPNDLPDAPFVFSFDDTINGTSTIADGEGFYAVLATRSINFHHFIQIDFDNNTAITISANKVCPVTDANVYAINETLSRITEAITDNCLKVKSDYYGRTDSQPYTSDEDGCGGLRVTTSGLKIRRAPTPAFFASLKDMFDGLRGIDNIGMGIESNSFIPGYSWLRIEPVEYFYQDIEILSLPFVPEAEISIQEQLHYSNIDSGYQKWEVERINGLDEPNSNRKYRTGLSSVNNTIDITSKLIAGSYAIETTRQQSFADTGAADTTYDNETFIICVERQAYGFIVEQGIKENPADVFSPQTLYNWRIRPFSNLMRWFKSIANSYANIYDSSHKLFFASGTGNFLAEGEIGGAYPACKLENGVKAENRDLGVLDFVDTNQATPLWKPEYATLTYPLSVADYKTLKANPYGYISFQCGTGEWKKGYVQNLRYRLNKGECDFTLKIKYS